MPRFFKSGRLTLNTLWTVCAALHAGLEDRLRGAEAQESVVAAAGPAVGPAAAEDVGNDDASPVAGKSVSDSEYALDLLVWLSVLPECGRFALNVAFCAEEELECARKVFEWVGGVAESGGGGERNVDGGVVTFGKESVERAKGKWALG